MIDFPEELLVEEEAIEEVIEEVHSESEHQGLYNYGPCKAGIWYRLLDEYRDWIALRVKGHQVFVPRWVFNENTTSLVSATKNNSRKKGKSGGMESSK